MKRFFAGKKTHGLLVAMQEYAQEAILLNLTESALRKFIIVRHPFWIQDSCFVGIVVFVLECDELRRSQLRVTIWKEVES